MSVSSGPALDPTDLPTPDAAWISLDGVVNMRDVGGLPTLDGGVVASGRLVRSDNLQDLSPAAVRWLVDELGLTDVVDLRTHVEVAKEGDGPLRGEPGVRHHHHTLYREDTAESGVPAAERDLPWRQGSRPSDAETPVEVAESPDDAQDDAQHGPPATAAEREASHDDFWSSHYLGYLAERPDAIVAALRDIALAPGTVIVHCAAGKDRTGTVVAMALTLAGVVPEAVVADYGRSAERIELIMDRLRAKPAYADNLRDKTAEQQTTRPDTMRLLLRAVQERGGVEGLLAAAGWTAKDTAALRAKLRS